MQKGKGIFLYMVVYGETLCLENSEKFGLWKK